MNLIDKTCSCREFQTDLFVCVHAIAACRLRNLPVESYCAEYYTTEYWKLAYAGVIHPQGSESSWTFPNEIKQIKVNPPNFLGRPAGRPKKRRIPSLGESDAPLRKCSRCGGVGHNRATCRNPIPPEMRAPGMGHWFGL